MRQALLIVDIQRSFDPPEWLIQGVSALAETMPSISTVERHDESVTPFERQLGWKPATDDECLILAERAFVKHGYLPPPAAVEYLRCLDVDRVLVCGLQTDTCVLGAGFALFDAGLRPTLLSWLTVGSSLDRTGQLGIKLWHHHFGEVIEKPEHVLAIDD